MDPGLFRSEAKAALAARKGRGERDAVLVPAQRTATRSAPFALRSSCYVLPSTFPRFRIDSPFISILCAL